MTPSGDGFVVESGAASTGGGGWRSGHAESRRTREDPNNEARTFLAASTAALALPAVSRAEKGSVLKFVPWGDLGQVDPIWTPYAETRSHAFLVYDTLYGQTGAAQNFIAKPQMVAGHVVEDDGRTWKLTLRDGLTFHDGTKVLARDCVASIRRWGARDSFGQALMQRID